MLTHPVYNTEKKSIFGRYYDNRKPLLLHKGSGELWDGGGRGEFNTLVSSCISRVYVTTSSALQLFGRVHSSVTQDGPACTSRGGKDVCGRLPVVLKTTSVLNPLQKKTLYL